MKWIWQIYPTKLPVVYRITAAIYKPNSANSGSKNDSKLEAN